jgi:PAS domain S-box-containing protein
MRCRIAVFAVVLTLQLLQGLAVTSEGPVENHRVLVLHSYHHGFTWSDNISRGIQSAFGDQANEVELRFEFMDTRRIYSPAYFEELEQLFRIKYGSDRVDVIICADDHALNFVLGPARELFENVPVVFCSVSGYEPSMREGRPLTGLQESIDIEATLESALDLHPDTKEVAVITDMTRTGRALKSAAEKVFEKYDDRVRFRYLEDLTVEELQYEVGSLSEGTIVFLFVFSRDKAGRVFSHEQNLRNLSPYADVPIYAVWEFYLDHGIVGGRLTSGAAEGEMAGQMAIRILQGEDASSIPLEKSPTHFMFDYEQLERFSIRESDLPEGSLVINRPLSFYEEYKGLIWIVGAIIVTLLISVVVLVGNIVLRKRAEIALRESEEKFEKAFTAGPDAILISRLEDGRVIEANEQFYQITKYRKGEVIGKTSAEISNWADPAERQRFVELLRETGQVNNLETRFRHKDGTLSPFLVSARLLEIHGNECVISITRDISDRKEVEEALARSEEKYRNILENIEEGYYEIDTEGRFTFLNESMSKIFGYPKEELLGNDSRKFLDEDNADKLRKLFEWVYQARKPGTYSGDLVTRKGKEIVVEASVGLRLDEADEVIGFRGIFLDVTSRRRAEEEKRRLTDQLQQAQKMEALGTLAGGIAHDFNNLLMGIQGRISLMMMTTVPSHPSFEHLEGMEGYVETAAALTNRLLGFARGGKYEVKPTRLNELVEKSADMFGRTKKELTIHNKFQEDLWNVEVDKNQIEQVLLNIFVNAWQAMPEGGYLYLQTENTLLQTMDARPFGLPAGKYVKVSVTDTGIGMDETVKARLFEPFFTTKGRGRGTGLGLASAYGIIKNHGGIIRVYSEPMKGTTFSIYLPASDKEPSDEIEAAGEPDRGEGTILLVDDEEMIIEVGKKLLEQLGYVALVASSGAEALETYRERSSEIDLVILDMIMPGMSGDETYDKLRRADDRVKVLLSSGYSIDSQASSIMDRGCNGFIQKPFNMKQLSEKIEEIFAGHVAASPSGKETETT